MSFSTASAIATFVTVVIALGLFMAGPMLAPASGRSRSAYLLGAIFAAAAVGLVAARFAVLA